MRYLSHGVYPFSWAILFSMCIGEISSEGISCFTCTVAPVAGAIQETSQICSQFDGSSNYQTYCSKSTLCMKRTIHHRLGNGSIVRTSVERGCALQLDVFHSYDFAERAWHRQDKIVQSVYQEGCFVGEDRGSPGGPPEYCYCQYPLCNRTETLNGQNYMIYITCYLLTISSLIFAVS